MPHDRSRTDLFVTFVLLACVFSLAVIKTYDYDAWIHLTFGREIWNLKGFPGSEPFIPAMKATPFTYSSWLFGVLYYGAYHFFGSYGVILLKACSVTAIFAILFKDSLVPCRNRTLAAAVLIVIAVLMRPRFVERPDTFLLIFLPFSVVALNLYLFENRKGLLYALPLVHMLWANSHSSINLMFVPFAAVLAGGALGTLLSRKGIETGLKLSAEQARLIAAILVASVVCAVISPYGVKQFTFAAQFLKLDVYKQEINELRPTHWEAGFRWFFILLGLTIASFGAAWKRFSLADLARIVPIAYLGFLSHRFTFVFAVIAAPVLIRNLSFAFERFPRAAARLRPVVGPLALVWIAAWTATSFAGVGPFRNGVNVPGFGFNLMLEPEGALSYMDRRNITGLVFNYFPWGQYIEWRDAPRRIPFVDGRGYLTPELMERVFSEVDLDQLADQYKVDAFLMTYPKPNAALEGVTDRDLGLDLPGWVLVYWDDVSLLYLKKGGKYDHLLGQDAYRVALPANSLAALEAAAKDPGRQELLLRELQRNVAETRSSRGKMMLGYAYLALGENRKAVDVLSTVSDERFKTGALACLGRCYQNLGDRAKAMQTFQVALKERETSDLRYRMGVLLLESGNAPGAVEHLKRAVALNAGSRQANLALAQAYRRAGREQDAAEIMKKVGGPEDAREFFKAGVQAYTEGKVAEAAELFRRSIAANPSAPLPYANLGFMQLDLQQPDQAFDSFQKALNLDQRCALAHYGVAALYKVRGDAASAREHWKRYLELEPSGYFARLAKKELEGR